MRPHQEGVAPNDSHELGIAPGRDDIARLHLHPPLGRLATHARIAPHPRDPRGNRPLRERPPQSGHSNGKRRAACRHAIERLASRDAGHSCLPIAGTGRCKENPNTIIRIVMSWLDRLAAVEELEDAGLDAALVAECERAAHQVVGREIRFSTPTFRSFSSCELSGCGKNSFPAFSVTAAGCALMCDHCQAKILEPMIPAVSPEALDRKVRALIAREDLRGFLLSGGSNRRNEIRYERYYPVVERLKRYFPHLRIAVHSALLDERRAKLMEAAGVDTAMMDVIGARETIAEVYHLERPVEDFEATLAALCSTSMEVVPHIVIGLHYERLLGEAHALDIVSRHPVHSL